MSAENFPRIYLYRRVVQAKIFIDNNFCNDIALNDIADEAFYSRFHFIRLFKMAFGKTPHQYLTSVRIENAKLLLQVGRPVADVCFEVGFESISSFTGLFKRITASTPSAYQKAQLQRKMEMTSTPLKFVPNCFIR